MNEQEYENYLELFRILFMKMAAWGEIEEYLKGLNKEGLEDVVFVDRLQHPPDYFYARKIVHPKHIDAFELKYQEWLTIEKVEEMMKDTTERIKKHQIEYGSTGLNSEAMQYFHLHQALKELKKK